MSKRNIQNLFILCLTMTVLLKPLVAQTLKVSDNGRYLKYENGSPFFYLGDTGWDLFRRLNREGVDQYLSDRAEKGFAVIQAVLLFSTGGLESPNSYGEVPLVDKNPLKPNEAYFKHVDYIVKKAEELGLFIGMLPSWGYYWGGNNPDDIIFTPQNAEVYGEFLGKRYIEDADLILLKP